MATKPKKNQRKSNNRGGPRPNSGRKPKPVTEIKQALISELAGSGEVPIDEQNDAAVYAFRLFVETMKDKEKGITTRLDCATEVLNRVWGKPTERRETKNETKVGVLDPDSQAALSTGYGDSNDDANPGLDDVPGDQPPAAPA